MVNISKRELTCLIDSLRDFAEPLITLASVYRYPYRRPKLRLDLQSQKTIFLPITKTMSLNTQIDKIVYHSDLETTISCVFSLKKFELHCNQFIPTEIINLNHREIHHLYKKRYYVANKCEIIDSNYNV